MQPNIIRRHHSSLQKSFLMTFLFYGLFCIARTPPQIKHIMQCISTGVYSMDIGNAPSILVAAQLAHETAGPEIDLEVTVIFKLQHSKPS